MYGDNVVRKIHAMRTLLVDLEAALEQQRPCVFCAVVETRGSTPQKAGAAMLVFADGGQRGTLGGGCVEAEVRQRALRVLSRAGSVSDGTTGETPVPPSVAYASGSLEGVRPEVLTFHLDDNYGWDD